MGWLLGVTESQGWAYFKMQDDLDFSTKPTSRSTLRAHTRPSAAPSCRAAGFCRLRQNRKQLWCENAPKKKKKLKKSSALFGAGYHLILIKKTCKSLRDKKKRLNVKAFSGNDMFNKKEKEKEREESAELLPCLSISIWGMKVATEEPLQPPGTSDAQRRLLPATGTRSSSHHCVRTLSRHKPARPDLQTSASCTYDAFELENKLVALPRALWVLLL